MSSEQRAIILENDDSSITYVGEWTTVQASTVNTFGNFGPALSTTLHSTTTTSSFIFPFDGSSMTVFGTVNIANFSTTPNPTWKCSVDGISLGPPNLFQFPQNNWPLCNAGTIPDGSHQLVVNVSSDGMPFYLDYIEYRPSSNVSLENSLIEINNGDSAIDYISGWSALGTTANQTLDPSGLVNVTFVGIQLSWYGFIPTEESHNASSGEYSIDGAPFAPFQLIGLSSANAATAFNQRFFITPTLEMGNHVLSARYTGSRGQTPFTLDYLIIANGSFPISNGGTNVTGTHSSNPTPISDAKTSSSNVGTIIGGVIGAIVGVAIVIIIVFVWFKFKRKPRQGQGRYSSNLRGIMPFYTQDQDQDQDRPLPALPSSSSPPLSILAQPPTQTTSFSKLRTTQHVPQQSMTSVNALSSTEGSTSNLNAPSLYTVNHVSYPSASGDSSLVTSGASLNSKRTSNRRPLPATPAPVRNATITTNDVVQHEDSGIRLGRPNEIPPSYTEL
ncbi:hypothetical protein Clacol_010216 [Clathrus columnatus]|uniref:Peptidase A1 domain-containing protein n=1 Tax=Clathrus columnatus TaxID=1419009 RepID=A0AAV5AQ50_9AGAM|nr:hypothetical protein Clacol_010216 [Clathrus columnatus]